MNKKSVLFYVLLILFVITATITLLGVLKVIAVDDFYLNGLFSAFVIELAVAVFTIATKGNILDSSSSDINNSKKTASLKLQFWGDNRSPEGVFYENIFRWYHLQGFASSVTENGNVTAHHIMSTLFVTFERDVKISTITVQSPNMSLPKFEVKEFNQRYAIIVFSEKLGPGTLEVRVLN